MRNSSYSFMPILLKLYRCFCHDLKICMWFGYYPEIIFCHFFCNLNLVIFKCTIMAGDINSLNLLVLFVIKCSCTVYNNVLFIFTHAMHFRNKILFKLTYFQTCRHVFLSSLVEPVLSREIQCHDLHVGHSTAPLVSLQLTTYHPKAQHCAN